jgi:serine/threonine protein kinase
VRHPNVVVVHGAELHDGRIGLWTDVVEGETLEQLLSRTGPIPPREAARIGVDVCHALTAVHAQGLVHGDVKASNVMRDRDGHVVLMDFGTVKEVSPGGDMVARAARWLALELRAASPPPAATLLRRRGFISRSGRLPIEGASVAEILARHAADRRPLRESRASAQRQRAWSSRRSTATCGGPPVPLPWRAGGGGCAPAHRGSVGAPWRPRPLAATLATGTLLALRRAVGRAAAAPRPPCWGSGTCPTRRRRLAGHRPAGC